MVAPFGGDDLVRIGSANQRQQQQQQQQMRKEKEFEQQPTSASASILRLLEPRPPTVGWNGPSARPKKASSISRPVGMAAAAAGCVRPGTSGSVEASEERRRVLLMQREICNDNDDDGGDGNTPTSTSSSSNNNDDDGGGSSDEIEGVKIECLPFYNNNSKKEKKEKRATTTTATTRVRSSKNNNRKSSGGETATTTKEALKKKSLAMLEGRGWLRSEDIRGNVYGTPKDYLSKDLHLGEMMQQRKGSASKPGKEPFGLKRSNSARTLQTTGGGGSSSSAFAILSAQAQAFASAGGGAGGGGGGGAGADSARGKLRPGVNVAALSMMMRSTSLTSMVGRMTPYVKSMQGPILFTAPHGIKLYRGQNQAGENIRVHKVERWSTEIALRLAESMADHLGFEGSSMVWDPVLIPENPDPQNLDPNYLSRGEFEQSPWHLMLREWSTKHANGPRWHIDVHGKRDRKTNWDLDVGCSAFLHEWRDAVLPVTLRECLCSNLEAALAGTKYTINRNPELDGMWGGGDCFTMAHQSVLMGTPAIQLEIPRSLRADLANDDALFNKFAKAIAMCYKEVFLRQKPTKSPRSPRKGGAKNKGKGEDYGQQGGYFTTTTTTTTTTTDANRGGGSRSSINSSSSSSTAISSSSSGFSFGVHQEMRYSSSFDPYEYPGAFMRSSSNNNNINNNNNISSSSTAMLYGRPPVGPSKKGNSK